MFLEVRDFLEEACLINFNEVSSVIPVDHDPAQARIFWKSDKNAYDDTSTLLNTPYEEIKRHLIDIKHGGWM